VQLAQLSALFAKQGSSRTTNLQRSALLVNAIRSLTPGPARVKSVRKTRTVRLVPVSAVLVLRASLLALEAPTAKHAPHHRTRQTEIGVLSSDLDIMLDFLRLAYTKILMFFSCLQ